MQKFIPIPGARTINHAIEDEQVGKVEPTEEELAVIYTTQVVNGQLMADGPISFALTFDTGCMEPCSQL